MCEQYVKVKVFDNEVEANFYSGFFEEENIPFYIRNYHDTAYDGIFTGQFGYADLFVKKRFLESAQILIRKIEGNLKDE